MILGITIYTICFAWLSYRYYPLAVGVFFTLLPTYLIRFSIGPLPSTVLEVMLVLLIVTGALTYKSELQQILVDIRKQQWLYYGTILFLIGATLGVLVSTDVRAALGEWKAFYIEPVLLILVFIAANKREKTIVESIFFGLLISGLSTIALVLYQGSTGTLIAEGYQGRATGWYGFPNGVGLFLGMLWGIILYRTRFKKQFFLPSYLFLILTPIALHFSRSTGAIIAILATIGILLLWHKQTRLISLIAGSVGLIVLLSVPQLAPIKQELLLQDRSGQIRTHMWAETVRLLHDQPILGAGLASYEERIVPYHTTVHGEGIEIFHHPHNIFLTMWVNTGIVGLAGFLMLFIWMIRTSITKKQPYLLAAIVGIFVLGLVDSPYIKNDIAIVFWLMLLFAFTEPKYFKAHQRPSET
jgi:O-antigen ligase